MQALSETRVVDSGVSPQIGSNTTPLAIVTMLFFMWGLLTSLNDVLIPHLKSIYTLNYTQAMLVQFCFFGAYFVVSVPAGSLIRKIGYQAGAVAGLVIAAVGCALFYPAAQSGYLLFLIAFFILAAGITVLQVAANPYVAVLGAPATASSRLTLTQAFNSLGTTIGPAVGGMLILGAATVATPSGAVLTETQRAAARAAEAATVQGPYLGLAAALLILGILFALVRLPRLDQAAGEHGTKAGASVLSQRHLVLGAIGIFVYVGGEVTIGSFLINFIGERHIMGLPEAVAAHYVSYYWGGAMVGRFVGSVVMRYISPGKTLAFNALCSMILIVTAIFGQGPVAMWALLAVGLFNSIMFPTIFSMALHRLGPLTGQGSGILCMAIVGGAVLPFAQGALADSIGLQWSFALPAACYAYILFFGMKYARMYLADHP